MRTPDGQVSISRTGGRSPIQMNKYMRDDGSYWISARDDGIDPRDRPGYNRLSRDDVDYNYREPSPALQKFLDGPEPYVPPAPEDMPEPPADVLPPDSGAEDPITKEKKKRNKNRGGNTPAPPAPPAPPMPSGDGNSYQNSYNSGDGSGNTITGNRNAVGVNNVAMRDLNIDNSTTNGDVTVTNSTIGDGAIIGNTTTGFDFDNREFGGMLKKYLKDAKKGAFGTEMAGGLTFL